MKSTKSAAGRMKKLLADEGKHGIREAVASDINQMITGLDQYEEVIGKQTQKIGTYKDIVNAKAVELINKDKVLVQKNVEIQNKDKILVQKEQLLSEISIREENQLKEEYINVLHQLYPKVFSANFEDWPVEHKAKQLLDSGNLQKMARNLVVYKELLNKELTIQKEEVQNKAQLILQKEQELKSLNDTFTTSLSIKEEEIAREKLKVLNKSAEKNRIIEDLTSRLVTKEEEIASKNLKMGEVSHKVVAKDNLLSDKEQRIEELKALIEQRKIETEELLAQKELALANKSHMKNQVINELREGIELKDNEVLGLRVENLEKELMTQEKEKLLARKNIELDDLLDEKAELLDENQTLDFKMQYVTKEVEMREAEKNIALTQKEKLSSLLTQKDYELNGLLIQQEIEKKELLVQKEFEVADKSFVKNQVIDQLKEEISDLNKQLSEHNIAYSLYLEEVGCQPGDSLFEKQLLESLNLSSINISAINDYSQNLGHAQNNLGGNFNIHDQHTTHSVILSGEDFSIIQEDLI